jgi:outer membrane protein TolC
MRRKQQAMLLAAAAAVSTGCTTPLDSVLKQSLAEPLRIEPEMVPEFPVSPSPPPGRVDGRVELSLEQAVLLTLQHNRGLAVEERSPVIAGAFEQIERGSFAPELFAGARYREESASETARATGEQFNVEGEDTESEAGLRRRFSTGTEMEAGVAHSRTYSDRTPEQQEVRLGLSVTQQLLRGLGPGVNLAAVHQAELGTLASAYELRGYTEALIADTEITYWEFVLAREKVAIFSESLEVAKRQLDDTEQRIEVGALADNEAAAARAEVARREQGLIEARSQLEDARLRLLQLVYPDGLDDPDFVLEALSEPRTEPRPIGDVGQRVALAARMRPDLNEARLRLGQRRLETVVTRNGLLPRLDLFINLGKSGYAQSFSDAFRDLEEDSYDLTAGLALVYEIGNPTGKARDRLAAAELDQAVLSVQNLRDLVALDVYLAVNEAERVRQQIHASAVTRAFEEESLRAEQERFAVGAGTALLLAQAQRDLLASQIVEVEAIVAYRVALVNLHLAEGTLLHRRGITVAATDGPPLDSFDQK